MLTLEQVREVNRSLQNGDVSSALKPLEETIDLRPNELPKLEKSSVLALQTGLKTPENAAIWAEAAFHPNLSVRRFVRRTFLGLKSGAAPIAAPLQARLERFWAETEPLPFSNKPREAAARREQAEMMESALEILLRADAGRFMAFFATLADAAPFAARQQHEAVGWQKKSQAYSTAVKNLHDKIIREEWGAEYLDWKKRSQLPSRVWREISKKVQNDPKIREIAAQMGENPWQNAAQNWQPTSAMSSVTTPYFQPDATSPQREIAAILRRQIWIWVEGALDLGRHLPERTRLAARLREIGSFYNFGLVLGREEMAVRLPALLKKSRPGLLQSFAALLKPHQGQVLQDLQTSLVTALARSCRKPYGQKGLWEVAASVTPEFLRGFKTADSKAYHNRELEQVAAEIEAARKTTPTTTFKTVPEPALAPQPNFGALSSPIVFSQAENAAISQEVQRSGESYQTIFERKIRAAKQEIEAIETSEAQISRILEPGGLKSAQVSSRLSFWQVWDEKAGGKLKEVLWSKVGPALWGRYAAKLEEYRRVEADEPTGVLGEKLTPSEQKKWKTERRREMRQEIQKDLNDMAALLRKVQGWEAEVRILELTERPGGREVARAHAEKLLHEAGKCSFGGQPQKPIRDADWLREHWFLEAQWAPVLAQLEARLLGEKKLHDWQREQFLNEFAVAYYRLNTPQGRARFFEFLGQTERNPFGLSAAVRTLGDVETWLLLTRRVEWPDAELKLFWTETRQNPSPQTKKLPRQILEVLAATSKEKGAKFLLEMVADLSPAELQINVEAVFSALESPVLPVKRWALATLPQLSDWDTEKAASLAGEMLWNENAALIKDAAKFLGELEVETAWEALQDATSLENLGVLEAIFRGLSSLKAKNKALELNETAREKLELLMQTAPTQFGKFGKKLEVAP